MHSLAVILAVGIGLVASKALAETESMCGNGGGASTITITETVKPVTVTVNIATGPFTVSPDPALSSVNAVIPIAESTDDTSTSTSYSTFTNVLSVVEATSSPVKSTQGPYSFAKHSGTTVWLGDKTPPSTKSFITKTSAITIVPFPESSMVPSGFAAMTTSFSTLTLTSTSSRTFTKTLTESLSTPTPSAKPFTGLAPYGWNSSLTTFRTVKAGVTYPSGHTYPTSASLLSARWDVPQPFMNGVPNWPEAALPIPLPSIETSAIEPRQVGAIIVATIEGEVVSWTNSYDGGMSTPRTSKPALSSSASPSITLAVYPWDLSVPPSPISSSTSAAPATVVGIYPWDLPPVPQTPTSSAISIMTTPPVASAASYSGWELQPGVPTMQPSFDASYMSSAIKVSPAHWSTTSVSAAPSSESRPASHTVTSVLSLVSLIPGPTGPANATSVTSTVSAPQPSCSDKSPFTIGFDDLPHFSIGNNPNGTDIPPIFNPYRKLYWENHFGYVPPPTDPFPPISGEQLAVYRVDANTDVDASPDAGLELIGEFGSGPRATESAYWIDAYSVYLGCANAGPEDCVITLNGYDAARSTRVASQTVNQPPCPGLTNCKLAKVSFNEDFRNLTGIQILAAVNRVPITWYMDDLELGWSNDTCEATTERNNHQ